MANEQDDLDAIQVPRQASQHMSTPEADELDAIQVPRASDPPESYKSEGFKPMRALEDNAEEPRLGTGSDMGSDALSGISRALGGRAFDTLSGGFGDISNGRYMDAGKKLLPLAAVALAASTPIGQAGLAGYGITSGLKDIAGTMSADSSVRVGPKMRARGFEDPDSGNAADLAESGLNTAMSAGMGSAAFRGAPDVRLNPFRGVSDAMDNGLLKTASRALSRSMDPTPNTGSQNTPIPLDTFDLSPPAPQGRSTLDPTFTRSVLPPVDAAPTPASVFSAPGQQPRVPTGTARSVIDSQALSGTGAEGPPPPDLNTYRAQLLSKPRIGLSTQPSPQPSEPSIFNQQRPLPPPPAAPAPQGPLFARGGQSPWSVSPLSGRAGAPAPIEPNPRLSIDMTGEPGPAAVTTAGQQSPGPAVSAQVAAQLPGVTANLNPANLKQLSGILERNPAGIIQPPPPAARGLSSMQSLSQALRMIEREGSGQVPAGTTQQMLRSALRPGESPSDMLGRMRIGKGASKDPRAPFDFGDDYWASAKEHGENGR